ncbi:MAG: tetratricopeptide repeat protein [Sandaracinus sp.]
MARAGLPILASALVATCLTGCPPTLSQERGDRYLDAMAAADRDHTAGRDEAAIADWREAAGAAERRVDRDEAEHRAALSLRREGRLDEALALFSEIAARRPISRRTVRAMFEVTRIQREQGRRDEANAGLRAIVFEHAGDGQASRALRTLVADLRANEGDDAAIALLTELDAAVPATDLGDDVLTDLAQIHRDHGRRAEARALYERIVAEHPYPRGQRWDDTFLRLADMAQEDGDPEAAVRYLERMIDPHALGLAPGSYTLPHMPDGALRIAHILRDEIHDVDRAAAAFRRMHDAFPTSLLRDDALVELGEMLLDAGRRDEGCAALEQAMHETEVSAAVTRAHERHASACASR